ncbi:MAG: hypothetical protein WBE34_11065 [Candidatus Nitrosopolaris sp.]
MSPLFKYGSSSSLSWYELHPLPDEDVTAIDELPVYSINKPKRESLVVLKILDI